MILVTDSVICFWSYTCHDESADTEKDQVAPFFGIGRKKEAYAGQDQLHDETDNRAPGGEVVHRYKRMGSLADPANRCECYDCAADAEHGHSNSCKSLFCRDIVVV